MHVEVNETLLDNIKVKRLSKQLGVPAVIIRGLLTTLWLQVLRHKEDGCLDGWADEEIGEYSEWDELIVWLHKVSLNGHIATLPNTNGFVKQLEDGQFIDRDLVGDLWIHDWDNYAGVLKRAEMKTKERDRKRRWRATQQGKQLKISDCPAPVPGTSRSVPPELNRIEQTGTDLNRSEKNIVDSVEPVPPVQMAKPKKPTMTKEVDAVVAHYRAHHPRSKPGKKERDKILKRFEEGWTVGDLKKAIDGCHGSAFHCGDNDHNRKYQSLQLIIRDSSKVQDFIELGDGGASKVGRKGKKNVDAVRDFVNRNKNRDNNDDGDDPPKE